MIFNTWFTNEWVVFGLKIAAVFVFFLTAPLVIGYVEHKVLAHMQARLGPMEAGKFHGWAQLIADGVKFMQKEDIIPRAADRVVFALAPAVTIIPALVVYLVLPFGPGRGDDPLVNGWWGENLDVGLFFVFAMSSISVIGMLMAGWASASKFSLIGAIRGAAQLIAYELPLVLAGAAVAMQAGTLSLVGIVEAQDSFWFVLPQFAGFVIFMMASLAELARPPFDMPIADSEIIFGHMTEYTGIRFGLFLLTEYAGIISLSAVATVLYLGGWKGVLIPWLPGPLWTLAKIGALGFFIIWLRATYPRLREDQLQRMSWKYLIPIGLLQILLTGVFKVAF